MLSFFQLIDNQMKHWIKGWSAQVKGHGCLSVTLLLYRCAWFILIEVLFKKNVKHVKKKISV